MLMHVGRALNSILQTSERTSELRVLYVELQNYPPPYFVKLVKAKAVPLHPVG